MGYMEGLLGGILEAKGAREAENLRSAELANAREASIFQALLGSDNPEIQSMALAGLLESAQPKKRKGGLRGWMGEMEQSPTYGQLQSFLKTPQATPVDEERMTLPSAHMVPQATQGPSVRPNIVQTPQGPQAAMSDSSPVEPSAPPPQPLSYTQSLSEPYTTQRTEMQLPQPFLTPEQRIKQEARAKGFAVEETEAAEFQGRYRGARRFMPHEEALDYARSASTGAFPRYGGMLSGQSLPLGTKDTLGRPIDPHAFYRRETVGGVAQYTPTLPPSSQLGTLRVLAAPNGRPAVFRVYPDNSMEFVREVPAGVEQIPVQNPDGSMEVIPVPRQYQAPSMDTSGAAGQAGQAPPAPTTPPPAPAAPVRTPAGGIQTRPSTAEQATTTRASTRLTTDENARYRTPAGTTWSDIDTQGLVPLEPNTRNAVDQIDIALLQLQRMQDLTKKVYGGTAPGMARILGPAMERLAQEGSLTFAMNTEDYQNLVAARNLAIPGVARRTGEVGNLTATEQERASAALPNLGEGALNAPDTLAAALSKIETLQTQLKSQRDIFLRGPGARQSGAPPPPGNLVPEELKSAPAGSVWEDDAGIPRWKKLADGQIVPY